MNIVKNNYITIICLTVTGSIIIYSGKLVVSDAYLALNHVSIPISLVLA